MTLHLHLHRLVAAALAALSFAGLACEPDGGVRVLVAGYEQRGALSVAMLWSDGRAIPLEEEHESWASGVAVAGSDVYVAGNVRYGEVSEAVYWKNGEVVRLTDGTEVSAALAIAAAGGSVYVVGLQEGQAMVWKDGVPTPLTTGALFAGAEAIAVADGEVYVAGVEMEQVEVEPGMLETRAVAKLWVNGVVQPLTDGLTVPHAVPNGIAVAGADVYVAMTADALPPVGVFEAALWTDDALQPLTDGSHFAFAEAIALAGTDVIVGGSRVDGASATPTQEPVLWRNGVLQVVAPGHGSVTALAAHGEDVYAVGYDATGAKLWVGGEARPIGDGTFPAGANAVAVQRR